MYVFVAVELLAKLKRIFWAQTKRPAERRYAQMLALQEAYVAAQPEAAVFSSLEHHWPKLVMPSGASASP
jgi:hypothetical protein